MKFYLMWANHDAMYLWDKRNLTWYYWWASMHNLPLPISFTINLGQRVVLSRFVLHHPYNLPWNWPGLPKFYELWVSDLDKPGDDLFGGDWTRIAQMESVIPSGQETPTADDNNYAVFDGENMFIEPTDEIPNPYIPCKFLRVRILNVWELNLPSASIIIGEIDLYGQKL